jgi:hypothetical protein
MRVYVGQLAVYFRFTDSINTQIFITPRQHQLEMIAGDKHGYISATILNIIVTSQSQTTISNIQSKVQLTAFLMIRSETVVTAFPTVADAGLESTHKHAFERLICEVCFRESASSALL